jgi:hypothetical protein
VAHPFLLSRSYDSESLKVIHSIWVEVKLLVLRLTLAAILFMRNITYLLVLELQNSVVSFLCIRKYAYPAHSIYVQSLKATPYHVVGLTCTFNTVATTSAWQINENTSQPRRQKD